MPPIAAVRAVFPVRVKPVRIAVDEIRIRNRAGALAARAAFLEIEFVEVGIAKAFPTHHQAGISLRMGAET